MASFNFSTRQMAAKIVYYGPGLCGKTTSLKYIFDHTSADARGKMVSLATETDRTLFFDLLPLEVGSVAGFHTRVQLYTVPGQVFYNSTRRLVLKGVDGIVFVADSQEAMLPANIESFHNLEVNLQELGHELDDIPMVLQYNKRDLPDVCPVETMSEALNRNNWPEFETSAITGQGIFEALREITKLTLVSLRQQLETGGYSPDVVDVQATPPIAESAVPTPEPPVAVAPPPMAEVAEPPAAEEAAPPGAEALDVPISDDEAEQLLSLTGPDPVEVPEAPPDAAPADPSDAHEAPAAAEALEVPGATNGHLAGERNVDLQLDANALDRAKKVAIDLQVRDGEEQVLHQIRDIEWVLEPTETGDALRIQLEVALRPKPIR